MKFKVWLKTEIDEHLPSILKGIKEFFRIVLISAIPSLVYQLESGTIDSKFLTIIGVVAVLKAIDKTIHERGKELGNENLTLGITRF